MNYESSLFIETTSYLEANTFSMVLLLQLTILLMDLENDIPIGLLENVLFNLKLIILF